MQQDFRDKIYIGTIALERNRWGNGRVPTYLVSEWAERFRQAGFDGMELWENHAAMRDEPELAAIQAGPVPVSVFNSYTGFDDDASETRARAAELATRFDAAGVKFNLGHEPHRLAAYVRNAVAWSELMPAQTRMLCECHGGTIMEDPDVARKVYNQWNGPRWQAIVHPFSGHPIEDLRRWFDTLGSDIVTHAHVAIAGEGDERRECLAQGMEVLREYGYRGSYTIEFTLGTGAPDEEIETMFTNALADLALLRKELCQ